MKAIASLVNVFLFEKTKNHEGVFQQNRLLCLITPLHAERWIRGQAQRSDVHSQGKCGDEGEVASGTSFLFIDVS
jgi:hypothetical protein